MDGGRWDGSLALAFFIVEVLRVLHLGAFVRVVVSAFGGWSGGWLGDVCRIG